MWTVENRRNAGNYGGDTFRDLILAPGEFTCMTGSRSLNPKSTFTKDGAPDTIEIAAWEKCVDMAYLYTETYDMSAIPIPFDGFNYTYTHSLDEDFILQCPDGETIGETYFYHRP